MTDDAHGPTQLTRARLFLRFLRFGALAFGGPVAQIAMIRDELVERERWISRERFGRTLAVYQALPGPEAHELCVYFGTIQGGRVGGLLAGLGFLLPGLILVLVLAELYVRFGVSSSILVGVLLGFQPAVAALIARAVVRIGRHALTHPWLWIATGLGAAGQALGSPFWVALLVGGLSFAMIVRGARVPALLLVVAGAVAIWVLREQAMVEAVVPLTAAASLRTPGLLELLGSGLKAGLLTFGGAYTAIPFVREDAVTAGRWLSDAQFLDVLGLSGILPAPLIIFGTFVGYLAGGLAGALAMTFGIFAPAFAFTMIGHRHLERLVHEQRAHAFLDGIAAAVVGLIAVTGAALIPQAVEGPASAAIFVAALAALVVWRGRWAVPGVMLAAGVIGLIREAL